MNKCVIIKSESMTSFIESKIPSRLIKKRGSGSVKISVDVKVKGKGFQYLKSGNFSNCFSAINAKTCFFSEAKLPWSKLTPDSLMNDHYQSGSSWVWRLEREYRFTVLFCPSTSLFFFLFFLAQKKHLNP